MQPFIKSKNGIKHTSRKSKDSLLPMSTESVGYVGPVVHTVATPKAKAVANKIGKSIKPKMKASEVLAGKKFDALEIKTTGTADTAPESPIEQMETKTKAKAKKAAFVSEFDPNPYGLKEQAEQWLIEQLQDKGNEHYSPLHVGLKPVEPDEELHQFLSQYEEACVEYRRLSQCETHDDEHPLVVLVGVGFDEELIEMSDGSRPKAHYLFFPELGAEGESALFITYLAGNVHGRVLTKLIGQVERWIDGNEELEERLETATDAGAPKGSQPDIRVYPNSEYTDRSLDIDPDNEDRPYSRLIVEIEWMNRCVVKLRQKGNSYFHEKSDYNPNNANDFRGGSRHVRMFLGCSLFGNSTDLGKMDKNDLKYEAALVLWKRNAGNDEIEVYSAIDFGTKDLSAAHKDQYEGDGPGMLPGVTDWTRMEKNGQPRTTVIPREGFLYEVSQLGNVTVPLADIEDFELDINKLVKVLERQLPYEIEKVIKRQARKRSADQMKSNNDK